LTSIIIFNFGQKFKFGFFLKKKLL